MCALYTLLLIKKLVMAATTPTVVFYAIFSLRRWQSIVSAFENI